MTLPKPESTFADDLYSFQWPGLSMVAERFQETRDDIRCELTVASMHPTKGGQLYFGRLLLMGPRSRADVIRALEKRDVIPDWGGMLEQVCTLSLRHYREGEPVVDLWTDELPLRSKFLLRPFILDGSINMIYGHEDSAKSTFSTLLGLVVTSGQELVGLIAEADGAVLYLDWETVPADHQERVRALATALGVPAAPRRMLYRRMTASLSEAVREVRKDIARFGVKLVIVDSLGMAGGGDPLNAQVVIQSMIAARSLGVAVLLVHHIARDTKDKSRPYGPVWAAAETRLGWYLEAERDGVNLTLVASHLGKTNRTRRFERQSYRFTFTENGREQVERIDVTPLDFQESKTVGGGGQKWQIVAFLTGQTEMQSVNTIAEAVGITREGTRRTLGRSEGTLFVKAGRGTETRWGVLSQEANPSDPMDRSMDRTAIQPPDKYPGALVDRIGSAEGEGEDDGSPF